jgi:hypothetical protein
MSAINKALVAAMRDISKKGIAKLSKADLGGAKVNYRGIEAAMNEMSIILIHNGITVTPSYSDLSINERAKGDPKDAKATRFATLKGSFRFASSEDDSFVTCEAYGEAMDSGDKAVTKAQSVAFRTALFQQFVVPTMAMDPEEDADGDGEGSDPDAEVLEGFRNAALDGEASLRKHYEAHVPTKAFWLKHSKSLKEAAKEADREKGAAA